MSEYIKVIYRLEIKDVPTHKLIGTIAGDENHIKGFLSLYFPDHNERLFINIKEYKSLLFGKTIVELSEVNSNGK